MWSRTAPVGLSTLFPGGVSTTNWPRCPRGMFVLRGGYVCIVCPLWGCALQNIAKHDEHQKSRVRTRNLDRLAKQEQQVQRAYAQCPGVKQLDPGGIERRLCESFKVDHKNRSSVLESIYDLHPTPPTLHLRQAWLLLQYRDVPYLHLFPGAWERVQV